MSLNVALHISWGILKMASGRLGVLALTASTNNTVYQVLNDVSAVSISVLNKDSSETTLRLAIATSGSPASGDWIEYDVKLPANGVLERTGIVLSQGEFVVAYTPGTSVVVRVHGYEE